MNSKQSLKAILFTGVVFMINPGIGAILLVAVMLYMIFGTN